jgi:hypothetical protein
MPLTLPGGDSKYGSGGVMSIGIITAEIPGANGTGYGAGGAGATAQDGGLVSGGDGTDGVVIIRY